MNILKELKLGITDQLTRMKENISADILSGVTVAVIALPLAIAFGVASGIGPQAGLWAAICGGIFVGFFGGSHYGVSGPTGPKVVQLAALIEVTRLATGAADLNFVFSIVFLSGFICIALAFCRIGNFIYYVPYSAISGFMCGIGIIIILLELPPILGFPTPNSVLSALKQLPYDVMHENNQAVAVAAITFAAIFLWPKVRPKSKIPGPLLGLIAGSGVAYVFNFDIPYVSSIKTSLPHLYVPSISLFSSRFGEMIGPALSLAGLCIFDSLLTCLVADNLTQERHNSDREIFGQGIANLACGLLGGVTTATATMRTVANIKFGARSGLSSVVHGLVLLLFMYVLAPLVSHIPMACLAGILLKVGIDIIDHRILPVLHRIPRADALCFWAVLVTTISVDLLVAMGVGLVIAFVRAVHDIGHIYEPEVGLLKDFNSITKPDDSQKPIYNRILKIRIAGPMFFGVADTMYRCITSLKRYDYLLLNLEAVPYIDLSGAYMLDDLLDKAKSSGTQIYVCNASEKIAQTLEKLRLLHKVVGPASQSLVEAIAKIEEHDTSKEIRNRDPNRKLSTAPA